MNRKIAIINYVEARKENVKSIVDLLANSGIVSSADIYVFTKQDFADINNNNVYFTDDVDTRAKARNFVTKHMKTIGCDYLHVIEDGTQIIKDPTQFINDIEHMMDVLDLNAWFGTTCDGCNYVYKRYNPRLSIDIDDKKFESLNISKLLFTSHANTFWTIFRLNVIDDSELYVREEWKVPMYYIIAYHAERRNNKKQGEIKYMNQYPTIPSEYGTYRIIENYKQDLDLSITKTEDPIFRQMNIDIHPDNNIDQIVLDINSKLNSKITAI